jgi:hypothetical protein
LGGNNMTEQIWDPLNKAAVLVTLMTGAPAFLVFIGLPTVAAIVLGLLSIASLLFAFVRSRSLQNRASRLLTLHAADETLLKSFNSLIASSNPADERQLGNVRELISKALQTLRIYVETDVGCEAKISIALLSKEDTVWLHTFASTGSNNFSQRKLALSDAPMLNAALSRGEPSFVDLSTLVQGGGYRNLRDTNEFPLTVAMFPIVVRVNRDNEQTEVLGVLTVDLKKKRELSTELQGVLLKYSHLFFLLFTQLGFSLAQVAAQPGAPGDAPQAERP